MGDCASTFTLGHSPDPLAGTEALLKLLRSEELLLMDELLADDLLPTVLQYYQDAQAMRQFLAEATS